MKLTISFSVALLALYAGICCSPPLRAKTLDQEAIVETILVDWDFSQGEVQGWSALHSVGPLSVRDGFLEYAISGPDPYAGSPWIDAPTSPYQYFLIELRSQVAGSAQLFWLEGAAPEGLVFNEDDSAHFEIRGDGSLERCIVLAPWVRGHRLFRLRIDAPEGVGRLVQIRRIALIQREVSDALPRDPRYDLSDPAQAAAWLPLQNATDMSSGPEGLVWRSTGGTTAIAAPPFQIDANEARWLAVELAAPGSCRQAELWYQVDPFPSFHPGLRLAFDVHKTTEPRIYNIDLSRARAYDGTVRRMAIVFSDTETGARCGLRAAALVPEPVGPSHVWVRYFRPVAPLATAGESAQIEAVVRNDGGMAARALQLDVWTDCGEVCGAPTRTIDILQPGSETILRWTVELSRQEDSESASFGLLLDGEQAGECSVPVTTAMPPAPVGPSGASVVPEGQSTGSLELANDRLSILFPWNPSGYGEMILRTADGTTRAVTTSLGELRTGAVAGSAAELRRLRARKGELYLDRSTRPGRDARILVLTDTWQDGAERRWRAVHRFRLDGVDPCLDVETELSCSAAAEILHFRLPTLLAGDTRMLREIGLFCGLEYLLPGERSSGTDFIAAPISRRWAPHPLRVTVPLMVVLRDGLAVGMTWDPLQTWDGREIMPSPYFASPDLSAAARGCDVMTLFVPAIPRFTEENELIATRPYTLEPGVALTLKARCFVMPASDVDTPLRAYLEHTGGLPAAPPMPQPAHEIIAAVLTEYTRTAWLPGEGVWNQAFQNPWTPAFVPSHALHMLWELRHGRIGDDLRSEVAAVLEHALAKHAERHPGDSGGWDMLFHRGAVTAVHGPRFTRVSPEVRRMREDGTFAYQPSSARHRLFGRAGDTSSGQIGQHLWALWQDALITGNADTIAAGLEGLEALDRFARPEGAQVWELDLHVPDVLAAAHAVRCFVAAYRITGEERYRERAVAWAFRGLPFIYLWNPPDRPIMRYGSIPVFGATWYSGSWFGRIVQWNGLELAEAFFDLGRVDASFNWERAATGIVTCALQQMRPCDHEAYTLAGAIAPCGHVGMYPDAYDPIAGSDAYHWCLSGDRVLNGFYRVLREDPRLHTEIVCNRKAHVQVHINSVARIDEACIAEDGRLSFKAAYPADHTHSLVLTKCPPVTALFAGGRKLKACERLNEAREGYRYDPLGRVLFIKLFQSESVRLLEIR